MYKKLSAILLVSLFVLSLCATAFASDIAMPGLQEKQFLESESTVMLNGNPNVESVYNETVQVDHANIKTTGETIPISNQRNANDLTSKYGIRAGTLTSSNTWDYYVFSSNSSFYSASKIVTNNSNYTMTLGVIDYSTGLINLTNYVTAPGKIFAARIGAGDYAWVIQSANGTYGTSYTLQYNMSVPDTDYVAYVTSDLQKLYSIGGQKLRINNQVQNVDYKLDIEWEVPPIGGGELSWQTIHIWMENANVGVVHVGGAQFYKSKQLYQYPNCIVLSVQEGGTFTHDFSQNPPYYNYEMKDMWGIATPRAITTMDVQGRGGHYLIYNIDTGKVEEFVSGLIKTWSSLGDHHDFSVY